MHIPAPGYSEANLRQYDMSTFDVLVGLSFWVIANHREERRKGPEKPDESDIISSEKLAKELGHTSLQRRTSRQTMKRFINKRKKNVEEN